MCWIYLRFRSSPLGNPSFLNGTGFLSGAVENIRTLELHQCSWYACTSVSSRTALYLHQSSYFSHPSLHVCGSAFGMCGNLLLACMLPVKHFPKGVFHLRPSRRTAYLWDLIYVLEKPDGINFQTPSCSPCEVHDLEIDLFHSYQNG